MRTLPWLKWKNDSGASSRLCLSIPVSLLFWTLARTLRAIACLSLGSTEEDGAARPYGTGWATRKTLPTRISGGSAGQTPAVLRTTVSRLRATSLRCGIRSLSDAEIQEDLEADADIASSNRNKPWLFAEATRCESPVSDFPCDGWCREPGHVHADDDVKVDVVSLAASKDSQFSWEDEKGISMTATLKADPHPSSKDLLTRISYAVYDFTVACHHRAKENKTKRKRYEHVLEEKMTRLKKAGSTVSLLESGASSTIWAPSVAVRYNTFSHLSKKASLLSVVGRSAFHTAWQSWNNARKAKGGNMDDIQTPQLAICCIACLAILTYHKVNYLNRSKRLI
ncbi:hypothetical protein C8J57DRAFT_1246749 [Mycena rebaudengoi]|nr:hypothetical protein C8J57DRAFT_1246749 [Mycena rebaudengoi]